MIDPFAGFQFWVTLFLGLIFGSFANVLIARLPQGKSILFPSSQCPQCSASIRWFDNVPVLSWLLLLRGRCRKCRAPISVRYPIVELITAVLFLSCWTRYGWGLALWLRDWPLMVALVAVIFIDIDHRIIPDEISLGGLAYGIATAFLDPRLGLLNAAVGAALGFLIFYGFAWLYWFITRRSGLGGGDIKLLAMLGAFIGLRGTLVTILVSSLLGSVVGVLTVVLSRRLPVKLDGAGSEAGSAESPGQDSILKASIPYGPFLVIGAIFYHLLGDAPWLQFMIPM